MHVCPGDRCRIRLINRKYLLGRRQTRTRCSDFHLSAQMMGRRSPLWMLSQTSKLVTIHFNFLLFIFFQHRVQLAAHAHFFRTLSSIPPIFLPSPPLRFFLFSPLIYYPPSLFLPVSHAFPASACSPFLLLSPALIEIQLCNSLSEDAIDLSPFLRV